jgi:hypothetical protein
MSEYDTAEFRITDQHLQNFKRLIKKPMDCVINALEIIGVIDNTHADIIRICMGDIGLSISQIVDIFKYMKPTYEWGFMKIRFKALMEYCQKNLKRGHVLFCGYDAPYTIDVQIRRDNVKSSGNRIKSCPIVTRTRTKDSRRHVFLIGKSSDGKLVLIDKSIPIVCDLSDPSCEKHISIASAFFILKCQKIPTPMQI